MLILVLFVLKPSVACLAQEAAAPPQAPAQPYVEDAVFSLTPPPGWEVVEMPGYKYKFIVGPSQDDYMPHINIEEEYFTGDLDECVSGSIETLKQEFSSVAILSQSEIVTNSGVRGVQLVTDDIEEGVQIRQVYYFFDGGKKKFLITCTRKLDHPESLDQVFEESIKTFVPVIKP